MTDQVSKHKSVDNKFMITRDKKKIAYVFLKITPSYLYIYPNHPELMGSKVGDQIDSPIMCCFLIEQILQFLVMYHACEKCLMLRVTSCSFPSLKLFCLLQGGLIIILLWLNDGLFTTVYKDRYYVEDSLRFISFLNFRFAFFFIIIEVVGLFLT